MDYQQTSSLKVYTRSTLAISPTTAISEQKSPVPNKIATVWNHMMDAHKKARRPAKSDREKGAY